jgi:membrane protein implicated in regulation of membrane protease activity
MFGFDPVWVWASITVILLIIEVVTGTFFLYLVAGSSALTALLSLFTFMDVERQVLLFASSALITTLAGARWLNQDNHPVSTLNNPGAKFIGREFLLKEPITRGRGRLIIHDAPWEVKGEDMPEETVVIVAKTEEGVLYVEKKE